MKKTEYEQGRASAVLAFKILLMEYLHECKHVPDARRVIRQLLKELKSL